RARERRDVCSSDLRELGRLSEADYQEARREPVRAQLVVAATQTAPYFADHVRQELEARLGSGALGARDVRVFTSLDLTLQRLAESAVERGLARLEAKRPTLRGNDDAHRLQAVNAATVRLAQDVGLPTIVERAHAFGIESRLEPVPAMALGSFEVTPLELARAYLPFLNGGQRTPPAHAVRAVQDPGGALDVDEEPSKSVMSPAEAYLMTSLLEGVITASTVASATAWGTGGTDSAAGCGADPRGACGGGVRADAPAAPDRRVGADADSARGARAAVGGARRLDGHGLVVRRGPPPQQDGERRAVRHARAHRGAPHAAVRHARAGHEPRQRARGRGAHQRSRSRRARPHHRPFLRRRPRARRGGRRRLPRADRRPRIGPYTEREHDAPVPPDH